ncbi:outer membrane beta-barrel protein, partial [Streptomyces monticola]
AFANEQNSISLGMLDLAISKKVNKASFVGEVAFGPRGQEQSLLAGKGGDSFHLQNLYVSYDFTDKFSMTAGFMGTFIGYEIISPTGNFNYSTSYLFSMGPFQNAGIKGTYTFSDQVSLMVGLFNDWNEWTAGKYQPKEGKTVDFMRRKSPYFFVDQYNAEFNRTIQPMKGGYT